MDTSTKTLMSLPKRAVAAVAALALAASMALTGTPAHALSYPGSLGTEGSITIHKFGSANESTLPGDGSEVPDTSGFGEPLRGVTFKLTQLDEAAVEKLATSGASNSDIAGTIAGDPDTYKKADGYEKADLVTLADGSVTASEVPFGYYLLQETGSPFLDKYEMSGPVVIALPYAAQAEDGSTDLSKPENWKTDIHVYPKNVAKSTPGKVTKTFDDGTTVPSSAATDTPIAYALNIGVHQGEELVSTNPVDNAVYTVTDLLPRDTAGNPVLDLGTWELKVVSNGQDVTEGVFGKATDNTVSSNNSHAKYFDLAAQDTSTNAEGAVGTENGTGYGDSAKAKSAYTWKTNAAFANAIDTWNKAHKGQEIKTVSIVLGTTVNENVANLEGGDGGTTNIANDARYWTKAANSEGGGGTIDPDDKPTVAVAGFGFTKTGAQKDDSGKWVTDNKPLANAKFVLVNEEGQELYQGSDSSYTKLEKTSGANGKISFADLAVNNGLAIDAQGTTKWNDIYAMVNSLITAGTTGSDKVKIGIKETQAPAGYQILHETTWFNLVASYSADTKKVTFSLEDAAGTAVDSENALSVLNFTDEQDGGLVRLPNTGGMGALLIVAAGAAAIGGAVYLNRRNKKAVEDDLI